MALLPVRLIQYLLRIWTLLTTSRHRYSIFQRLRLLSASAWRFIKLLWSRHFRKSRTTSSTTNDEKFDDPHPPWPSSTSYRQEFPYNAVCESRVPPQLNVANQLGIVVQPPSPKLSTRSSSSSGDIGITVVQADDDPLNASEAPIRRPATRSHSPSLNSPNRSMLSIPRSSRPSSVASTASVASRRSLHSIITDRGINPIASALALGGGDCASIGPSKLGEDIECMVALDLLRYIRKFTIGEPISTFTIKPLKSVLESTPGPKEWTRYVHPDGAPYYHHEEKRIFTDSNLLNEEVLAKVEHYIFRFEDWIRAHNFEIPNDAELVLQVLRDDKRQSDVDDGFQCGYYYAQHSSRSLFWLEDNNTSQMFDARFKEAIVSESHAQLGLSVSYWQHWEYFSCTQTVTPDILNELSDNLVTMLVDVTGSSYSNSPFSIADLQIYLAVIREARKMLDTPRRGSPWFVGRLFSQIQHQRFIDFFGQHGARLYRNDSVFTAGGSVLKRTRLINTLSPFLFSAPDVHLANLGKVFTDDNISITLFNQFISKLHGEWQDFVINAAVLLAANMAFLAIQSVDNEPGALYRSPAQIASYLSTVASISSIAMGLLLTRQTRNMEREIASEAATYLYRAKTDWFGHEPLAIMYSLPFVFLMYAMVFFMVAFSLLCFLEAGRVTKIIFGAFWAFCLTMIAWTIYLNWEKPEALDDWLNGTRPRQILADCHHWLREYVRELPNRYKLRPSEDPEAAGR
ncbi:hypothetical protein HGRIS_002699 [Hohenbuehelia grisea]|uniref:Uncharacterized protein n=1 Tax=Hohenbuehelia grisea TaxID=104357 RepID=A0ABR3JLF2_9AGAR